MTADQANALARQFVTFLETGNPPDGLFTDDVFCDFTMPLWRLQAQGVTPPCACANRDMQGQARSRDRAAHPTPTGLSSIRRGLAAGR